MNQIRIQINHETGISKIELATWLYNEIGEEYSLSEDDVFDYINIESYIIIPNSTFVTVFSITIPDIEFRDTETQDIIDSYMSTLQSKEGVVSIVKLHDSMLYNMCYEYYKKIFELEMELRNVLTYILTYDSKQMDKDLFKEFGIRLAETFDTTEATNRYENGLFYILFNHYASFSEPSSLKAEKIAELLQIPSIRTFEEFKQRIQGRYILEDRHTAFLFSIKEKLNPLEKMRNAIMHIRNLPPNLISNFEKAAYDSESGKGIHTLIGEFWENERNSQNEKTWIALAKLKIKKLIRIESGIYIINEDYYDYEFDENYTDINKLKSDLFSYLIDNVVVPEFHSRKVEFESSIEALIDDILH